MSTATLAPSDLMPLDELAQRLKLSPRTVRRLHEENGLPLFKLAAGGRLYALWPDVARWIQRRAGSGRTTLSSRHSGTGRDIAGHGRT